MNATITTAINTIGDAVTDENMQRAALGVVSQLIVSFAAFSLLNAALGLALWAWLAALLALIATMFASYFTGRYMRDDGYDHAVNACAWVKGLFS